MENSLSKNTRIWQFEALRGFLCWWVVADHIRIFLPDTFPEVFIQAIWGGHAVNVFIILSGFVISLLLERETNWISFIKGRFFRLWPAFVVCILIASILPKYLNSNNPPLVFLSNLTMLHGIIPESLLPGISSSLLPPSWSISLEWQFYLVAPFLFIAIKSQKVWVILLLIACMAISRLTNLEHAFIFPSFLPLKLHYFFIGILSYVSWNKLKKTNINISIWIILLTALLVAAFTKNISLTIWTFALGSTLPGHLNHFATKYESTRIVKASCFLGKISYSTYLIHWPLLILFYSPFIQKEIRIFTNPYLTIAQYLIIVFLPIISASFIIYNWIEKPFNRYGKRRITRHD
ncbi:acyltransferase family protein [Luteolibacter algae]|uniref:Acyltransferase family protein n=1 Tax=Luteolibacter algae TaxID=454151 RepID=A0ABW5D780_9BACT